MIKLILPRWLRDEMDEVIAKQIHLARGLQARLVDHERNLSPRTETKTEALAVVAMVRKLDEAAGALDRLAGGSRTFAKHADDMRVTMEFAAYCERCLRHQARYAG